MVTTLGGLAGERSRHGRPRNAAAWDVGSSWCHDAAHNAYRPLRNWRQRPRDGAIGLLRRHARWCAGANNRCGGRRATARMPVVRWFAARL